MIGLARRHRTISTSLVYTAIATGALFSAYLARFEFVAARVASEPFLAALTLLVVIRLGVNYAFRLGMGQWRYVGNRDYARLIAAETVGSVIFFVLTSGVAVLPFVPRSVVLLEWVFNGYATAMTWVSYRLLFERAQVRQASSRKRVLIVGAGEAGELLVSQMRRSRAGYLPVGIVDDNRLKWGTHVHGVQVLGALTDVGAIAAKLDAEEIVIGIPSASATDLRRIVQCCEETALPLKILPGIDEVLSGTATLSRVRDVRVEDLLGRDPIRLELPELARQLADEVVLVTGAAGSIGSELVRQIALHKPRRLILLDQAETPLYYLELDLLAADPPFEVVTVVGSVTDPDTVTRVVRAYTPDRVFHAAAYKHVPLMQTNPEEAVRTNVLGTYLIAEAAARAGAGAFILVSTDKAARPANVMGATKQMAERVVLYLQSCYPSCAFGAVRFGNVLGSSGSVLPVFRRQLERGEPLTVTDESATRYFMTIPEAVQLILQASLLQDLKGQVAMLDMGEPVRIADLARDLLRLSGQPYRPGGNIVITGLRPGEKLHEELIGPHEEVVRTSLERVFRIHMTNGFAKLPRDLTDALRSGDLPGVERRVLERLKPPRASAPVAERNGDLAAREVSKASSGGPALPPLNGLP
jgi:FlaA1/EpsC-like NDP-sugar epimerase